MQHFISTYGYLAIFLLMVAESACIPVPSELTMPLGGALAAGASAGVHMNLVLVIAVGVAGNVAGSYIAWAVGRYGGQSAWRRITTFAAGSDDGMTRAQRWFDKYGARSVFIGRLLPVIRTFISLPAGFARMQAARFGLYTVAGCIPWITGLTVAGYAVGANWHRVTGLVQYAGYAVGALAILLVASVVVVRMRARRRRRATQPNVAAQAASAREMATRWRTQPDTSDHADADRDARVAVSDRSSHRKAG